MIIFYIILLVSIFVIFSYELMYILDYGFAKKTDIIEYLKDIKQYTYDAHGDYLYRNKSYFYIKTIHSLIFSYKIESIGLVFRFSKLHYEIMSKFDECKNK